MGSPIESFSGLCSSFQRVASKNPSKETVVFFQYVNGEADPKIVSMKEFVEGMKSDTDTQVSCAVSARRLFRTIADVSRNIEDVPAKDFPKMLLTIHTTLEAIKTLKKHALPKVSDELERLEDNLDVLSTQIKDLMTSNLTVIAKAEKRSDVDKLIKQGEKILGKVNTPQKVDKLKVWLRDVRRV